MTLWTQFQGKHSEEEGTSEYCSVVCDSALDITQHHLHCKYRGRPTPKFKCTEHRTTTQLKSVNISLLEEYVGQDMYCCDIIGKYNLSIF